MKLKNKKTRVTHLPQKSPVKNVKKNKSTMKKEMEKEDQESDSYSEFHEEEDSEESEVISPSSPTQKNNDSMSPESIQEIHMPFRKSTMKEEIKVMQQVFLNMSKKKEQQKQEQIKECKRLYLDAFKSDVDKSIRRILKLKLTKMEEINQHMTYAQSRFGEEKKKLQSTIDYFKTEFHQEQRLILDEVDAIKRKQEQLDVDYHRIEEDIKRKFLEKERDIIRILERMKRNLYAVKQDHSFERLVQEQVKRLEFTSFT